AVGMRDDEVWRELADDPSIRGADLLLAFGVGTARRVRERVFDPLAVTATALVHLGARIVTDEEAHPRLADLTSRGEQLRTDLEESAKETVRVVLRWTVEHALAALDLTTLVRRHVDLDALAADLDVDAVVAHCRHRFESGFSPIVVVSEGAAPLDGGLMLAAGERDAFGHVRLGGIGAALAAVIEERTNRE
ncbi:hypothetical protein ACTHQH_21915, partial [Arthrobacter sp. SAFR-014]